MDKKYQIFVSSTYTDLLDERAAVTEAIIKKKHIPIAMEYFSASSLSQLDYIKKLLDFVDYYILIIGGRYGSIDLNSDKSYTQLEFEYAVEKKIPIITFYPKNPSKITQDKLDTDPVMRKKLEDFTKIAMTDRMALGYEDAKDLKSGFIISLDELMAETPRTGWIRGDQANDSYLLEELKEQKKIIKNLKGNIEDLEKRVIKVNTENVINIDEDISVFCAIELCDYYGNIEQNLSQLINVKLVDFLSKFGYKLFSSFSYNQYEEYMDEYIYNHVIYKVLGPEKANQQFKKNIYISDKDKYSLLYQLHFLNFIDDPNKDIIYFTEAGKKVIENCLIYRKSPSK